MKSLRFISPRGKKARIFEERSEKGEYFQADYTEYEEGEPTIKFTTASGFVQAKYELLKVCNHQALCCYHGNAKLLCDIC